MSTSIRVRPETKARLDRHGRKNQSYDQLLNEIMDRIEYPNDPATPRQVELLKTFGVEVPPGLTKQCASFGISAVIALKKLEQARRGAQGS
jgi:hypothetical protein